MRDAGPPAGGPRGSDPTFLRKQLLDGYGIDIAILTGYFYPAVMEMQFEFADALTTAYNDWMIDHWLSQDDRLLGSIQVAPQDPKLAAREIDRLGSHPRMVQVMLPVTKWPYGDPYYHPIFEAAERNDLVVGFHQQLWFTQGALGGGRYYAERHMVFPETGMALLASLYCNGVFERFPRLRFTLIELGFSWLNHVLWRYDKEYREFQQEIPWVKNLASTYFLERVRWCSQPMEDITAKQLMMFLELVGSDEILLYGSDYPHFDFDPPKEALPRGLPQETIDKIMFRNAAAHYRLDLGSDRARAEA
jgi:uncharacterized protein